MSWEEKNKKKLKCPCGLGSYVVNYLMDDWNRTNEQWEMNCSNCKRNYQLFTYYYQDSGKEWSKNIWIKKEDYRKYNLLEKRLKNAREKVTNFSISFYLKNWISYFENAKSKKQIWQRLTDNGKRYPSISTFYTHIKDKDINTYLTGEFNYDNLKSILIKLNIKDKEINKKLKDVKEMENKFVKAKKQLLKNGFN